MQGEPPFAHWVERGQLLVRGKLSAQELRAEYAAARLFVAPVRNATGVATKNFHSMGSGLPVLTTAMGLAGMKLPPRDLGLCCDASASNTWATRVQAITQGVTAASRVGGNRSAVA